MGKEISSLAVLNESVFAAAGDFVGRYVRGKEVGRFVVGALPSYDSDSDSSASTSSGSSASSSSSSSSASSDDSDSDDDDEADPSAQPESLGNLLLFGNTLVALSLTGKRMYVWDVPPYVKPASKDPLAPNSNGKAAHGEEDEADGGSETDEDEVDDGTVTPYATLEFPDGFSATKVVHPASYLNKVVVGSKEGALAVWNVRTGCVCFFAELSEARRLTRARPQLVHPHLLRRRLDPLRPFRRHCNRPVPCHRRPRRRPRERRLRPV